MTSTDPQRQYDWFPGGLPTNIDVAAGTYIESAYCFARFLSRCSPGLVLREGAGIYDGANLMVGPNGRLDVGAYTCLNSPHIICNDHITIGDHVFVAWGAVLTDTWDGPNVPTALRRAALEAAAADADRVLPVMGGCHAVVVEDAAWIGFDAVVLPGVRLGRGCIVGAKSVVTDDVPPNAIVAGNPARVIRYVDPTCDYDEAHQRAIREYRLG